MCFRQIAGRWSKVLVALAVAGWLGATGVTQATVIEDLSADSVSGADGTAIATWTATTGDNAVGFTTGHQALLQNGVLNGHNVLSFGGVMGSNYTGFSLAGLTSGQPCSVFVVAKINGNNSSGLASDYVYDGGGQFSHLAMAVNPTGSDDNAVWIGNNNNVGLAWFAGGVQKSLWQQFNVWEADYNGASSAIYRNGQLVATGDLSGLGTPYGNGITEGMKIGTDYIGSYALNGEIARFVVVSNPTAVELTNMNASLGATYGITIPEPGALAMLVSGLLGLLAYAWRRRR